MVYDLSGHRIKWLWRYAGLASRSTNQPIDGCVNVLGTLLKSWRTARRMSQMALALDAGVSMRHLSCVETGKSSPSRDVLDRLADALNVPLRERNALLVAAGYAPRHPETALGQPALAEVQRAIDCILAQQEPYPAFLLNRQWDVLRTNAAAVAVNRFVMHGRDSVHNNMLLQVFDPEDLRGSVENWREVAGELIRHLHRELAAFPTDTIGRALLNQLLRYPGVPADWRNHTLLTASTPVLTTVFRRGDQRLRFFSTITSFGMPRDVTLEELHIECCFPVDDITTELCKRLAQERNRVDA